MYSNFSLAAIASYQYQGRLPLEGYSHIQLQEEGNRRVGRFLSPTNQIRHFIVTLE